jgi:hypothetical protein
MQKMTLGFIFPIPRMYNYKFVKGDLELYTINHFYCVFSILLEICPRDNHRDEHISLYPLYIYILLN